MEELYETTLCAVLKWTRLQTGMTLQNASDHTGLSLQYISEMERGKKEPSPIACNKLLSFYGYSFAFHEEDKAKGEQLLHQVLNALMYQKSDVLEKICFPAEEEKNQLDGTFFYKLLAMETGRILLQNNYEYFPIIEKTMEQFFLDAGGSLKSFYCFLKAAFLDARSSFSALKWIAQAVAFCDEESEPLMLAYQSSYLMKQGKLISSLKASERAIYMAEKNSAFPLIQLMRMNQAIIYVRLHQYEDAVQSFQECLEKAELNNQTAILWKIHENICFAYMCAENYEKAADYAMKQEKNDPKNTTFAYIIAICNLIEGRKERKIVRKEDTLTAKLYQKMKTLQTKPQDTILQQKTLRFFKDDYLCRTIIRNYLIRLCVENGRYQDAMLYLQAEKTEF